jgi:pimeloyl-ACP methyl ester carboxylesterase
MASTALHRLDGYRHEIQTRTGPVSYVDTGGSGRPALFIHGLATSNYLWHGVIDRLGGERRCLAPDLPLHGRTPARRGQDLSLTALAGGIDAFRDALDLTDVDLVANDTGGAIAQIFAAIHPARVHTFTLTNCDTEGNFPPKAFAPAVLLARLRLLAFLGRRIRKNTSLARKRLYGAGYQDVSKLPLEVVRAWVDSQFGTRERARGAQRLIRGLRGEELAAIGPALERLRAPTLLVWGTDDVFFELKWAYWLRDKIPGASEVVEIKGGRLFFPDERADELAEVLRKHWAAHP